MLMVAPYAFKLPPTSLFQYALIPLYRGNTVDIY